MDPRLEDGLRVIEPLLASHGFERESTVQGRGSGGSFDATTFGREGRAVRFSLRHGKVLPTFLVLRGSERPEELSHSQLLRAAGQQRGAYPTFSEDPGVMLEAIAIDLEGPLKPFLSARADEFDHFIDRARMPGRTGLDRLAEIERDLEAQDNP